MPENKVRLIKQKYHEFASRGIEEELECLGMVFVGSETVEGIEQKLKLKGESVGATHIYGVEYINLNSNGCRYIGIYGDAYKPKKDNNGPYR